MIIVFYIICAISGLAFGIFVSKVTNAKSCEHDWKMIQSGELHNIDRYGNEIIVGFSKIYECKHCKKMKTEKVHI